jgi:ribonuclease P protein component
MSRRETFRPSDRLKNSDQFNSTIRRGERREGAHLVVYGADNDKEVSRLGITASRKVGKAVTRNWWKRQIREIFRQSREDIPAGFDFVVIVKPDPSRIEQSELEEQLLRLMGAVAEADAT